MGTNQQILKINRNELTNESLDLKNRTEIGSYSLDIGRNFVNSKVSLRYLVKPPNPNDVEYDLRKGFETKELKVRGEDKSILYWIKENMEQSEGSVERQSNQVSGKSASRKSTTHMAEKTVTDQDNPSQQLRYVQSSFEKLKISKGAEGTSKVTRRTRRKVPADFVCRRGLLTKIMLSPYERMEGWFLGVTPYNGTYYIHEITTEERKEREEEMIKNEQC